VAGEVRLRRCRLVGAQETGGRAAAAALSILPAFCSADIRTGRAPPFSQRFWPASE